MGAKANGEADKEKAERIAAVADHVFVSLKHMHGITQTWRQPLGLAASLLLARRIPTRMPSVSLPGWQRKVVLQAVRLGRRRPARRVLRARYGPDASVHDRIAARMGAVLRIAAAVVQHEDAADVLPLVLENDRGISLRVPGSKAGAPGLARIRERCDLWNELMLLPILSVRALKGDEDARTLPPSLGMAEAGRRVLWRQMTQFLSREYGLGCREDREFVHEARVATRRMRALLRAIKGAYSTDLRRIKKPLLRVADALGEARDSDVFLAFLAKYEAQAVKSQKQFLRKMIRREQGRCRRRYRKLAEVVGSPAHRRSMDALYREVCRPLDHPGGLRSSPGKGMRPLARVGPRALFKRLKSVWRYKGPLRKFSAEELHRLRILCKRLRYLAEFLADVYPGRLQGIVGPAIRMQDLLGDVHDVDVYVERIRLYRETRREREPDKGQDEACEALCACLAERRKRRLKQADATWKRFTAAKSQKRLLKRIRQVNGRE